MPSFIKKAQNQSAVASIDIGSNAMRSAIAVISDDKVEIIETFRAPLRLGEDVFNFGRITKEKIKSTEEAFIELLHLFTEFNVTDTRAMATSAMRDAKNGRELIERIHESTGIEIEVIDGKEEAKFIFEAVKGQIPLGKKNSVLMDIGGGSTEITVAKDGVILGVHSFNIGTIRLLRYENQEELELQIKIEITKIIRFIQQLIPLKSINYFIGTGGNLRRIGKIRKKTLGKDSSEASLKEIQHMKEAILSMSYIDRIRKLELDKNRADVILPAILLTSELMAALNTEKIHLPKVGLKEGILLSMLPETPKKFLLKD